MKKRTLIQLALTFLFFFLPFFFFWVVPNYAPLRLPMVVDKIRTGPHAGKYLVTDVSGKIVIMNFETSEIVWETDEPHDFVHGAAMMPDGNSIIVADTSANRVFVMNISNKVILWEWYAKNNTHDTYMDYLNWTEFGLTYGWNEEALAIVQDFNPPGELGSEMGEYTHLNKVQFINGSDFNRTYDTILISVRNFDMVIEVNYTAQEGEDTYMNITWHYGMPGDHATLNHQHMPTRWNQTGHVGHTTICDSDNNRIIEIDANNTVVWEYTDNKLRWPRDCDLLPNGNYLITDSGNNRIIEVNRTTNSIVRTFTDPFLFIPYEADYIEEDNQIVTGVNQIIIIFDYETGKVVKIIGFAYMVIPFLIMIGIAIIYISIDSVLQFRNMQEKSVIARLKSYEMYSKFVIIGILAMVMYFLNYIAIFYGYYILH